MNTCYLLLPPIALPFQCSNEMWWTWLIFASIVFVLGIIAKITS